MSGSKGLSGREKERRFITSEKKEGGTSAITLFKYKKREKSRSFPLSISRERGRERNAQERRLCRPIAYGAWVRKGGPYF